MGPRTDCTLVVPWKDHPELREGFQDALLRGPMPEELVVVDDGSSPPLVGWWRGICSGTLSVAVLTLGSGYQAAVNVGVAQAGRDVVVILNNDVSGGDVNWLHELVAAVRGLGATGALTGPVDVDAPHTRRSSSADPVPYIDGWCIAGWKDRLVELGPFTGRFAEPAYYADNDLCARAGLIHHHVPAGLVHKGNVTAGLAGADAVRRASQINAQLFFNSGRGAPTVIGGDGA